MGGQSNRHLQNYFRKMKAARPSRSGCFFLTFDLRRLGSTRLAKQIDRAPDFLVIL